MESIKISKYYNNLTTEQKGRFQFNFSILIEQCQNSMVLRSPYRFVLDSNIIMRLEDIENKNYTEGLLSVMLFFNFYKYQTAFHADLVITPVVFYEFIRLKNVGSLKDHWNKFRSIRNLVEDSLGVEVQFENLGTFEQTEHYINLIEKDVKLIHERLVEIGENSFRYDFIRDPLGVDGYCRNDGLLEVPPIFAVEHLFKEIDTSYFNPFYVSLFLKDHMIYKLSNNPKNNKEIIKKYGKDNNFLLKEVLFLDKKNRVKGLADIELFTKCNVRNQFTQQANGNYYPASISLTIDENLFFSLNNMSGFCIACDPINGGENLDSIKAKMDSFHDDSSRRTQRADEQTKIFLKATCDYLETVTGLF